MNETTKTSHRLMVLLFTDIKGSVDLKTRLGGQAYLQLITRHDGMLRDIINSIRNADILNDTGDGCLVGFETASDAVVAALRFQHEIHEESWDPEPIKVRIGLHIGEVTKVEKSTGQRKFVGLPVDIASRVMDLALPGQILLTRTAFDDSRQNLRKYPVSVDGDKHQLQWIAHGSFKFSGLDVNEPLEVFEVGVNGIAPLKAPEDSTKASRARSQGEADLLGWRPAAGQCIPERTNWILERKLGEGGVGEVWLARHRNTNAPRVFKFCFESEHVRSLMREVALFRLIRVALGDRPDIARLLDVQLEFPPYYLESEFTDGGNLLDWAETQGGLAAVDIGVRLEIVAKVADAVAAAHSVNVLHHDIKPKNILIETGGSEPQPRLADFGIGTITDRSQLEEHNISMTDFGTTTMGFAESSESESRLYLPPESLVGRPFTSKGDIYALGVLLYQLVVADTDRTVSPGWERDVEDEILRQDIADCVDQDPDRRLGHAWELADRIRRRDERGVVLRKSRNRRRMARVGSVVTAVLIVLLSMVVWYSFLMIEQRDHAVEDKQTWAILNEKLRLAFNRADRAQGFGKSLLKQVKHLQQEEIQYTVLQILDGAVDKIDLSNLDNKPLEKASLFDILGDVYFTLGYPKDARQYLWGAVELRGPDSEAEPRDLLSAKLAWAKLLHKEQEYEEGEKNYLEVIKHCESMPEDTDFCAGVKDSYARLLIETKQYEEAKTYAVCAMEAINRNDPKHSSRLTNLATIHQNLEEYDEARELFKQVRDVRKKHYGSGDKRTLSADNNLATFLYTIDEFADAEEIFRSGWEIAQNSLLESEALIYSLHAGQAACLTELNKIKDAEPILLQSFKKIELIEGGGSIYADRIRLYLVRLYELTDRPTKAEEWRNNS